jgi:hypothetical protein
MSEHLFMRAFSRLFSLDFMSAYVSTWESLWTELSIIRQQNVAVLLYVALGLRLGLAVDSKARIRASLNLQARGSKASIDLSTTSRM